MLYMNEKEPRFNKSNYGNIIRLRDHKNND